MNATVTTTYTNTTTKDGNSDQVCINVCSANLPKEKIKNHSPNISGHKGAKNKNPAGRTKKATHEFRVETRGPPQPFTATLTPKNSSFDFSCGAAAPPQPQHRKPSHRLEITQI